MIRRLDIEECVGPERVPRSVYAGENALPVFQTLVNVASIMDALALGSWGPTGSVAYELTTGRKTVARLALQKLMEGLRLIAGRQGVSVDVQIDTGVGHSRPTNGCAAAPPSCCGRVTAPLRSPIRGRRD